MLVNKKNLRKVAATVACLAGMTTFTQAQTPVTINVGTLGGANASNSGNTAESQWSYDATNKGLTLLTANGNYTLTGTNSNMYVFVNVPNVNVTLNNINITTVVLASVFLFNGQVTTTLIGNNTITAIGGNGAQLTGGNQTFNGNGSLTVNNQGFLLGDSLVMSIEGNAVLTVNAILGNNGIQVGGGDIINIGANATLNATGKYDGIWGINHNFTLNCDGTAILKCTDTYGQGIRADNATVTITGSGSVSAEGNYEGIYLGSGVLVVEDCSVTAEGTLSNAINTSNNIKMNDAAKLTMKTVIGETHTFEASNSASTYEWKLTNATTTNPLTDSIISVSVAPGQIGTVERVNPVPVTYTITATAGTGGSINPSGVITVNAGTDQTFTFSANSGYEISQVLIDNLNNFPAVAAGSYTFTNVTANHKIEVYFSPITGISEATAEKMTIYPNPTSGQLRVSGDIWDNCDREIIIFDVIGQVVFTSHLSKLSPETTIDISHLSAGLYFFKVDGKMVKIVKE